MEGTTRNPFKVLHVKKITSYGKLQPQTRDSVYILILYDKKKML